MEREEPSFNEWLDTPEREEHLRDIYFGARQRIAEIINGKMIEILPQVIADNNIDVDSISGRVSFNVGNLKTTRVSTVVSLG